MLFVDNLNEHDPALNLALEEYILRNGPPGEDLLLFYINAPSIIIGRNQNTIEEINLSYVEQHGIHVVRRMSGGGAVYHDLGNLNFSFVSEATPENKFNFKKFTEPVVQALRALGVPAELSGRNDILANERKISGNSQYISKGRMVSHGTLLFDTDLSHVGEALNVRLDKIASKGIKSVRSRVANISEFLAQPMTVDAFRAYLLEQIYAGGEVPQLPLGPEDWASARQIAEERYRSWEWNFGHLADYNVEKRQRFPGGEIDARLDIAQGLIRSARFFGDFFSEKEPAEIEKLLVGVKYLPQEIARALEPVRIQDYFAGVDQQAFVEFLV